MKITGAQSWREHVPLTRPYTIATRTIDAVELFFVRIDGEGDYGLGSASPAEEVTGESPESCGEALFEADLGWLVGHDLRHLGGLARELEASLPANPAARAAVEMALLDLFARRLGLPLVQLLGRCHEALPTSITVGIQSTEEALADADEYLGRGFRCLKVKVGHSLEEDRERLRRLREKIGPGIAIRIDGNQGYSLDEARELMVLAGELELELVEQPVAVRDFEGLRSLPKRLRQGIAADESLCREGDAIRLAARDPVCGIFNIKLMKCGGVGAALTIAAIANTAGLELMWGCNDESAISIAAALHAAYACPATRYLDLDGSFDLARDPALGGFVFEQGHLRLTDEPGLGVRLAR